MRIANTWSYGPGRYNWASGLFTGDPETGAGDYACEAFERMMDYGLDTYSILRFMLFNVDILKHESPDGR